MAEASEGDTNPSKKIKFDKDEVEEVFERFWSKFSDKEIENIKEDVKALCCERSFSLVSLYIENCDAGFDIGIPFSRATCFTKQYTEALWPFGGIFLTGYTILRDFLKNKDIPKDSIRRFILARLLKFLCDEDSREILVRASQFATETSLTEYLGCHFFSKLSCSSDYMLNKHMPEKDRTCPCGCGINVAEHCGNTSLGHASTWHGNLDILLGSMDMCAAIQYPTEESLTPGGKRNRDVNKYYGVMEKISNMSQTIAQTIVFSFYQRARHKENKNFLVPSIGASGKEVIFFFYDSHHDVLLQSKSIPLTAARNQMSYIAIVAVWLVVNYKYLCTGLTNDIVNVGKAGFFKHAKESLRYFENELTLGETIGCSTQIPFDPFITRGKFTWPENFPPNDL